MEEGIHKKTNSDLAEEYRNLIKTEAKKLPYFSSPEEYWMQQGKLVLLKELIERIELDKKIKND